MRDILAVDLFLLLFEIFIAIQDLFSKHRKLSLPEIL